MSSLHNRAKDLFLRALVCAPADRAAYLTAACGDDGPLREEVESLLAFHDEGGDASAFVPGYVFAGRYRMITPIGQGGMGEVWRADDLVLQTPVALKLI